MIITEKNKKLLVQSCKEALLFMIEGDGTPNHEMVLYENRINILKDDHIITLVFGGHKDLILEDDASSAIINEFTLNPFTAMERFINRTMADFQRPLPEYNFDKYAKKIEFYQKEIEKMRSQRAHGWAKVASRTRREIERYENVIKKEGNWEDYTDTYGHIIGRTKIKITGYVANAEKVLRDNFADNVNSVKEFLSRVANHPATQFIGITALVAIMIYISYRVFDRHLSKAAKACSDLSGKQKTMCIQKHKLEAYSRQQKELVDANKGCADSIEPNKCSVPIVNKIKKIEMKMAKLKRAK